MTWNIAHKKGFHLCLKQHKGEHTYIHTYIYPHCHQNEIIKSGSLSSQRTCVYTCCKHFYPKHYIVFGVYILPGHDSLGIKHMTLSVFITPYYCLWATGTCFCVWINVSKGNITQTRLWFSCRHIKPNVLTMTYNKNNQQKNIHKECIARCWEKL